MAVEVARQTAISARLHRQGTAATGVSAAVWTGDTLRRDRKSLAARALGL